MFAPKLALRTTPYGSEHSMLGCGSTGPSPLPSWDPRRAYDASLNPQRSQKGPPMAGFCKFTIGLQAPNLATSGAKSPIVSGGHLKYSRFRETATGDRVRSGLRGSSCALAIPQQWCRGRFSSPSSNSPRTMFWDECWWSCRRVLTLSTARGGCPRGIA